MLVEKKYHRIDIIKDIPMAKIYISSTFEDLKVYRKAVYDVLYQLGHKVIAMEDYVASDKRPLQGKWGQTLKGNGVKP